MSDDAPVKRRVLRFSLLTLLLVMAIVAMSITVAMLYVELRPLRKEVAELRAEVGRLNIEDPTKLHVMRVDTDNELEWKWRIWVPEGASYALRGSGGSVPQEGFPTDGGTMYLREPGEHVVRYLIRRDPKDNGWYGSLHLVGSGSVGKQNQPWVDWSSRTATSSGPGSATKTFETGERVEIIRHRVSQAKSSADIEDPSAGFMVWLEPQ